MSTELAKREETGIMQNYTGEQVQLIKDTVAKGATDNELKLYLYQANKTGLDPLAKQIYCVKRWDSKANKEVMAVQTGIDGFRVVADRTGLYAGNDDPVCSYDGKGAIESATVTVYKIVAGIRCPFTATARWAEYYPGDKMGFMWRKMPHVMLGKCAESLALRKAFPADLSGIYTHDEMAQADAGEHKPAATTVMGQQPKAEELPPAQPAGVVDAEVVEPQQNAPADPVQPTAEPPKTTERKTSTSRKQKAAAEGPKENIVPTDRTLNHPVTVGGKEIMTAGITQEQVLTISALQKVGDNKKKIQGFLDAQKVTGLRFLTELEGKVILGLIDNPIADSNAKDAQIKRFWAIVDELGAKDDVVGIKQMLAKMFDPDNPEGSLTKHSIETLTVANDFLAGFKGNAGALAVTLQSLRK